MRTLEEYNGDLMLHVIRNPHGWDEDVVRKARLEAADEVERLQGYKEAFYKIAEALEIPAMPISPKQVFETVILPKLKSLTAIRQGAAFHSGDTVILEINRKVTYEECENITEYFKKLAETTGILFLVLPEFMRVVEKKEQ